MIEKSLKLLSWFLAGLLLCFTVRRWLFMIFALLASETKSDRVDLPPEPPTVLLLAAIRNEAQALPEFLAALDRLSYPAAQLTIVLVDDGSTDRSGPLMQAWTAARANRHLLSLKQSGGKANALNFGLTQFEQGDIIAIYDADERPRPDALHKLVLPFRDQKIGAVSGRRAVSNALASPASSYTTFEGLVHQLVTLRAKDRLNLAPAILGANCAYRRPALARVGNFKPGALLEDSDLTLKLARAGWKTRFEAGAISFHTVPETVSGYWQQHTRWARGFNEVAKDQARAVIFDRELPISLRLELVIFSLGYLDRLALLAGGALLMFRQSRRLLAPALALSLLTPLFQIMAALKIGREPAALWSRIIWVPFFFFLDMAMAVVGLGRTLQQSPKIWEERGARR